MAKACPTCGLINTPEALRCDCGHLFEGGETLLPAEGVDRDAANVEVGERLFQEWRRRSMLYGALWCVGGTVATVLTYFLAENGSGGGRYFIAWGAIVFGAIQFVRGWTGSRKHFLHRER